MRFYQSHSSQNVVLVLMPCTLVYTRRTTWRALAARHSSAVSFGCVYSLLPGGSTSVCLHICEQTTWSKNNTSVSTLFFSLLSIDVLAALTRSAAALGCNRAAAGCVAEYSDPMRRGVYEKLKIYFIFSAAGFIFQIAPQMLFA